MRKPEPSAVRRMASSGIAPLGTPKSSSSGEPRPKGERRTRIVWAV